MFSARPLCDACAKIRIAPAEKADLDKKTPARLTFELKYTTIARYAAVAAVIVGLVIASRFC